MVKRLRDLNKKVGEAEFKMLLADLTSELGDAKLEAANLKIELADLKATNESLKSSASQRLAVAPVIDEDAYIFGDNSRHYCTACYDVRNQKVLLNRLSGPWKSFGTWQCPQCDKTFGPASH